MGNPASRNDAIKIIHHNSAITPSVEKGVPKLDFKRLK